MILRRSRCCLYTHAVCATYTLYIFVSKMIDYWPLEFVHCVMFVDLIERVIYMNIFKIGAFVVLGDSHPWFK